MKDKVIIMTDSFQEGWKYFSKTSETGYSAYAGQVYCTNVESAIQTFENDIYDMVRIHGNLGIEQCKGFVAEVWQANTFNINAALNNSPHKAFVVQSTELGSVDVSTNFEKTFSLKYLADAKKSAAAQTKNYYASYREYLNSPRKGKPLSFEEYLQKYGIENNPEELLKSVYDGQYRLIPTDQLKEAVSYLEKLIKIEQSKDGPNRSALYKNYLETLKKLTDRISDGNGVESIPLDKQSAEVIVQLCKDGNFKADDFGINLQNMITTEYILQQALKAGYTASIMSLVMEIAPDICDLIILLIKTGELDESKLKEICFDAVKGSTKGFIRGYVSCALTVACKSGKLGTSFMNIDSNAIAAITILVMDTVKNAYLYASGKISEREMYLKTVDGAIVTICGLIGGSIGTSLLPELAVFGYMIGSFVGSVIGTIVVKGKNTITMALCANTGITLFGIVDQDYTLSQEMIKNLGLHVVEPKTINLKRNELKHFSPSAVELNRNNFHSIDTFVLRRGVIGVRKIGYL